MKRGMKTARFKDALKFWTQLGFISFGGPAGQIAIMHQEVVERRNWIGENQFLRALNFCMLLPGTEAQQLATYIGCRLQLLRLPFSQDSTCRSTGRFPQVPLPGSSASSCCHRH
jgi:chromate transporter